VRKLRLLMPLPLLLLLQQLLLRAPTLVDGCL